MSPTTLLRSSFLVVCTIAGLGALPAVAGMEPPPPPSPITFNLTWVGVGNGASAVGTVTFADRNVLRSPTGLTCSGAAACGIIAVDVIVSGASMGSGSFTLTDFNTVVFNASLRLNLSNDLIGQPGFTDFNLFGTPPAPGGEAPFVLNAGGSSMRLVSMIGPGDNTLVVTSPSMGCAAGGTDVLVGIDLDRDDTLDVEEIESTTTICNGEDGANPLVDLVAADATTCPAGGQVMTTGLDIDGDSVLDAEEVTDTATLCDGAAGTNGVDGAAGANGADGAKGADGEDGGCAATPGTPALWLLAGLIALGRRRRRA